MLDFGFYNMDCMEGMGHFPDEYFDLAVVDPPYGDASKNGGGWNRFGERFDRYKYPQTISEQQNQIRDLIKQMQANNRRTASMNTPPEQDLQTKTDEIMAELIRPSIKKGE